MSEPSVRRRLTDNLKRLRDRIADAAARARRDPADIALVAVTKYVEVDVIRVLLEIGQLDLGEHRVQQLVRRAGMIAEFRQRQRPGATSRTLPEPRWHMIGHVQRNKVKSLLPHVEMIHSLDSLRLAEELNDHAARLRRTLPVLLEVNAAEEKSKTGVGVGAVCHLAEIVVTLPALRLIGLMTMAPYTADESAVRRAFARTREVFDEARGIPGITPDFRHLSMGMSNDFPLAIAEGATILRIGSALYEGLSIAPAETQSTEA